MKRLIILLIFASSSLSLLSQSDSLLFRFYHMKNGEVLIGNTKTASDSVLTVIDMNLGEVQLALKSIDKLEPVYKGKLVKMYLADNSVYRGRLMDVNANEYLVEMELAGMIRIKRSDIKEIELLFEERLDAPNPNGTQIL